MKMAKRNRVTAMLPVLSLLSACSPGQMYDGPVRRDAETSFLSFNTLNVDIIQIDIDGRRLFAGSSVALLPGPHTINVQYKDRFENTDLAFKRESRFGDESNGLGTPRAGSCTVNFSSAPGQSLELITTAGSESLIGGATGPSIEVKELGSGKPVLHRGMCGAENRKPTIKN
jgi:hypothetical protein